MSPSSESSPSTSTAAKFPVKKGVRTNLATSTTSSAYDRAIFSDGTTSFPNRAHHPSHTPTGTTEVLTFYPTMQEFKDFPGYIQKIERENAHSKCGICKVVPPVGWHPRPSKKNNYSDIDDYMINSPVIETIEGFHGVYEKTNSLYKKKISVAEFRQLANKKEYKNPTPQKTGKELEDHFFDNITQGKPIYGADTEGSIYDADVNEFNMNRLGTVLDETRAEGKVIKGVNSVYLYFGMYKTCFPWHAEDMDLYSINYLHFGAPKYWFAISSDSAERFEKIMDQYYPAHREACRVFLRHKIAIVSPEVLRKHGIPYGTMIQRPNEFIITFPKGYHMGFNLGYNCAESTNFATDRWIDFGKNAVLCKCRPDNVEIDMRPFMKKYRPDEHDAWHTYWYEKVCPVSPSKGKRGPPAKKRGRSSLDAVVPEGEEVVGCKNWIREQKELWNSSLVNMKEEKEENRRNALRWPHCAVCQIFNATRNSETKLDSVPMRSPRLMSSRVFEKTTEQLCCPRTDVHEDDLVTCTNCQVTVHPSCYGGEQPRDNWLCFRCRGGRDKAAVDASFCCLCEMRSGALLPCERGSDKGFVHVVCAIFNRRTTFDRTIGPTRCISHPPAKQGPNHSVLRDIDPKYVTAVTNKLEMQRFECDICKLSREGLIMCETCAPDDNDTDSAKLQALCSGTMVHTTCGQRAGFLFEERDCPKGTAMVCNRHRFDNDEQEDKYRGTISVGENVVVHLQNGDLIDAGTVVKVSRIEYLVVQFLDSTYSSNTFPHDVVRCSCRCCDKKRHERGARLLVKWTDGHEYDGYYRNLQTVYEYTIKVHGAEEGAEPVTALRSDLYSSSDMLPASVRKRLQTNYAK